MAVSKGFVLRDKKIPTLLISGKDNSWHDAHGGRSLAKLNVLDAIAKSMFMEATTTTLVWEGGHYVWRDKSRNTISAIRDLIASTHG